MVLFPRTFHIPREYHITVPFKRLGDHPVLDFCNTLISHRDHQDEYLNHPDDLRRFFLEFFESDQRAGTSDLKEALELRGILRSFFYGLIGALPRDGLLELNEWLARNAVVLQIGRDSSIHFSQVTKGFDLGPLLRSLDEFMTGLSPERLKKCGNPNCSHLFYDRSKNNLRQWCSMKSCGNIMKARAFYQRKKGAQ